MSEFSITGNPLPEIKTYEAVYTLLSDGREVRRTRIEAINWSYAHLKATRQLGSLLWRADIDVKEITA